jgi:hypothetical protein
MFVLAAAIGLIPIPWALATFHISRVLYQQMTIGLVPSDRRFNDASQSISGLALPAYALVLPAALLMLTAMLAHKERRRGGRWGGVVVLCVIAFLLGAASWFVGLVGLAATIWNE